MDWAFLLLAGCFEVVGVVGINKVTLKNSIGNWIFLLLGFICSFGFLTLAMQKLSLGISYAVWSGIGTTGGVIAGMIFYGESRDAKRLFFIALIITTIIGLYLIT